MGLRASAAAGEDVLVERQIGRLALATIAAGEEPVRRVTAANARHVVREVRRLLDLHGVPHVTQAPRIQVSGPRRPTPLVLTTVRRSTGEGEQNHCT